MPPLVIKPFQQLSSEDLASDGLNVFPDFSKISVGFYLPPVCPSKDVVQREGSHIFVILEGRKTDLFHAAEFK